MKIYCYDIEDFLNVINGLVLKGLGFDANATTYTITLTGAF